MRALSPIPVTLITVLATLTGCGTSPTEPGDTGHTALLVVAPSAAIINGGGTLQLRLSARDEHGKLTSPTNVTWTTSNQQVASIAAGIVTARAVGSAEITASWNGAKGVSLVTVVEPEAGPPQSCGSGGSTKSKILALKQCLVQ